MRARIERAWSFGRGLRRPRPPGAEVDEEIRFHIEHEKYAEEGGRVIGRVVLWL